MKKLMMLAILCTGVVLCACRTPKCTKTRTSAATQCMTECPPCEVKSTPMQDTEVRSKCCGKCNCGTNCGCTNCNCRSDQTEVTVTPKSEPTDPDRKCSKCNCGCANCSCKSGDTEDETNQEAARVADPTPVPMPRP